MELNNSQLHMFTDHVKVINRDSGFTVTVSKSQEVLVQKTENRKEEKNKFAQVIRDIYKSAKVIRDMYKLPRLSETYIKLPR